MQVPNFIIMLGNRRNLIFRVSIVFNIAVLLNAAVHSSGNSAQVVERATEFSRRYLKEDELNDNSIKWPEPCVRIFGEFLSQKVNRAPMSRVNKTVSKRKKERKRKKTCSNASETKKNVKRKISAVPSKANTVNEPLDVRLYDDSVLTKSTLKLLPLLLGCNDKIFFPETMQRGEYWVLKNYVRASHGAIGCHETITYTTHSSFEFLDNLPPVIDRWMAPVSLAIHAPGSDMMPTVNSIRYLRDCMGNDHVQQYATFHIFFSNKHIPSRIPDPDTFLKTPFNCTKTPPYEVKSSRTYKQKKNLLYPINVGRNIARSAALTHFVLPSDIQMYPSPGLVPKFLNMIARNEKPLSNSYNPRVFPITLFEVDKHHLPPTTKSELQVMLRKNIAVPFHKYVCPSCHDIPNEKEWMAAPEEQYMGVFHVSKRLGKQLHWEPIFIGTNEDPYYDERLSWEGKQDKITQDYVLCVKDYDFMILNNAFLVHSPGIKYINENAKRPKRVGKQGAYIRKVIFQELKKLFGVKHGCMI